MRALEIIGLIITFIAFAVIGYCLPIPELHSIKDETKIADVILVDTTNTNNDTITPPEIVADSIQEVPSSKNSRPQNINVHVGMRNPRYRSRVGLPVTVTAEVETDDPLECLIKINETSEVIIAKADLVENKCSFADVKPIDGGTYYICVKNTATGETSGKYINGFDKISKWTAEDLTQHLNASQWPNEDYFHLAEEVLTFDCTGIDPEQSEIPKSFNRLLLGKDGHGWEFNVTDPPKYDQYNRITYFKVNVTNAN